MRQEHRRSDRRQLPPRLSGATAALAANVTRWTGSTWGFAAALAVIVIWAVTGPLFDWSDTWQLAINTGTTIVTFLMVFLIQRTQNKDGMALHLKLNELIAAMTGASNRLIAVEDLTEEELRLLHANFLRLVQMACTEESVMSSHSVEEAELRHGAQRERRGRNAAA